MRKFCRANLIRSEDLGTFIGHTSDKKGFYVAKKIYEYLLEKGLMVQQNI